MYEEGEQPGIHEVLSPELAASQPQWQQPLYQAPEPQYQSEYDYQSPRAENVPIPASTAEPEFRDRSTTSTQEFGRSPRIFKAMAEAEERERAMARSASNNGGSSSKPGSSIHHQKVASLS